MEEETNKKEKKKNIIIVILSIIIVLLIGALVFLMIVKKADIEKNIKDDKETEEKQEVNNELTEEEKETLINELGSRVITKDNSYGMYYDYDIEADTSKKELMTLILRKYIEQNNLEITDANAQIAPGNGGWNVDQALAINASDIENFVKNNFYINNDFKNIEETKESTNPQDLIPIYIGSAKALYKNGTYYVGLILSGSGAPYIVKEATNVEKDGDTIYLYEKALYCYSEQNSITCNKSITTSINSDPSMNRESVGANEFENVAKEIFNTKKDELYTYKHEFKIIDGKYYYMGTSVEK